MTDYATEVSEAVDGLMGAFEELKKTQDKRLEELELRLDRPGVLSGLRHDQTGAVEEKAWTNFLRRGREGMEDYSEVKSLIVGDDTRGGYLAPPQFVAEVLKNIVEYSPVRQAAKVGSTSAGSVILPRLCS